MLVARRHGTPSSPKPRPRDADLGLPFFSKRISENRLVERQVRHGGLQPPVFVAQLLELAQLADIKSCVLLLPPIKRRLGHAHFATDVDDRRAAFGLPKRLENLLRRELALPHLGLLSCESLASIQTAVKT